MSFCRPGGQNGRMNLTGQQTLPFGDRIRALPLDALWRIGSVSLSGFGVEV